MHNSVLSTGWDVDTWVEHEAGLGLFYVNQLSILILVYFMWINHPHLGLFYVNQSSSSCFYVNQYIIVNVCAKNDFCISIPVTSTSTFNLLTSKLLCQLLLTWVTYVLNLNVVRFSFFRVTREHTTDRQLDWVYCNA